MWPPGQRSDAAVLPNCITAYVGSNGGQCPPIDFPILQAQFPFQGLRTFRLSKKAVHSAKNRGATPWTKTESIDAQC
jgi:hypothetical protein